MGFLISLSAFGSPILLTLCGAQLLPGLLTGVDKIIDNASKITSAATFLEFYNGTPLGPQPASIEQVQQIIQDAINETSNPLALSGILRLRGVGSLLDPVGEQLSGCGIPCTDQNTGNPLINSVYDRVSGDAPWSVPEQKLREALYIPPEFTLGKKIPVIMVPGTGTYAFSRL